MAKAHSVEDNLDRLAALRADPLAANVREELASALSSKVNLIAAKAAAMAAEFKRTELQPELIEAFGRFLGGDSKSPDKGCAATTAIAKAIFDLGVDSHEVYLAGVRHFQREGWGGGADSAAELRGVCALGLVRMGYKDSLLVLTDLLSDPEPIVRSAAARGLAGTGQDAGTLLLRLKLACGDKSADVLAECMTALVKLWPRRSVDYVGRFMNDEDTDIRDAAALALGESRQPEALELLRRKWNGNPDAEFRGILLLALAMLRLPEAIELMISIVGKATGLDAVEAIEAMAIYKHDPAVRAQVEAAVKARDDAPTARAFRQAFGG